MSDKREQILSTACKLFSENGFFATGVDQIMAEAGISKRTLYRYFPTKTDLIVAVIAHYQSLVESVWQTVLESGASPEDKLYQLFELSFKTFSDPGFRGCMVVNVMGEYEGKSSDVECACKTFKRWELETLSDLAKQAGAKNPHEIGVKLLLVLEGLAAVSQVLKEEVPEGVLDIARAIIGEITNQ